MWFKVADSGIGIAPAQLARIVEPFEQANPSTMHQFGGSGLGLSICKDLVQVLHGDFVYASSLGHGSVFIVAVPCAAVVDGLPAPGTKAIVAIAVTTSIDSSPSLALIAAFRPLVLLADDNSLNIQVMARQLERAGCDVVRASNGAESVEYVRGMLGVHAVVGGSPPASLSAAEGSPHLASQSRRRSSRLHHPVALAMPRVHAIFLDLHMPVMDGFTAAREIRKLEAGSSSRVPIFALTADDPDDVSGACHREGMDGVIHKPVSISDLTTIVEKLRLTGRLPL